MATVSVDFSNVADFEKVLTVVYDEEDFPGFAIDLKMVSRAACLKVTQKKMPARQRGQIVDPQILREVTAKKAVMDWRGLKVKYAYKLMPIKSGSLSQFDPDDDIGFTVDNAVKLFVYNTDAWIWLDSKLDEFEEMNRQVEEAAKTNFRDADAAAPERKGSKELQEAVRS